MSLPLTTHTARNEELWDAFVQRNGGNFLQSWGWSRFQEAVGRTAYRFHIDKPSDRPEEMSHEDTVTQFILIEHALPFGLKYAYIPRGPILARARPDDREPMETFLAALRDALNRKGHVFARVDFPWTETETPVSREALRGFGFRPVKSVQPNDTQIIDLTKAEEALLEEMHSKTRYNIRLAERHGVVVREAVRDNAHLFRHDLEVFWRLMGETSSRDNFHAHQREYYETMLDALSPKKQVGLVSRLFFAEYQGQAIAAAVTCEFGDAVTYLHGASTSEHRKVMAPQALHWEIMRRAQADGFKKYDLWGIAPTDDSNHPWAGITRFKKGFGGYSESYIGSWELPGHRLWYRLYRWAKRLRGL
jgi:lipid II:glycine glycyltransferase (peptidoglycan interpeptide bridge formation enzyme)